MNRTYSWGGECCYRPKAVLKMQGKKMIAAQFVRMLHSFLYMERRHRVEHMAGHWMFLRNNPHPALPYCFFAASACREYSKPRFETALERAYFWMKLPVLIGRCTRWSCTENITECENLQLEILRCCCQKIGAACIPETSLEPRVGCSTSTWWDKKSSKYYTN